MDEGRGDDRQQTTAPLDLIESASTLTMATAGDAGPWSAPVYYVFRDGNFFFFSSPQSRHIQQAITTGKAAASLYHQSDAWQEIRGIQMTGSVQRIRSIPLSLQVIATYLKRFPFTLEFFPHDPSPDAEAFFSRFKARLYAFCPSEAYYIDNRFGFGKRQAINLPYPHPP